uniref:Uncharacterized protein n=1 Tax=Globodera rostochiensis TaxID=31243 RepID=A0A914H1X1_GLORO
MIVFGADVLSASPPTRPLTTSTTDHPLLTPPQFELSEQSTEPGRTSTQATSNLPPHSSNSALKVEQQPSPKLETGQHQRQENTDQNQNNSNGTATAAKLESGWQLVEQKFMAEMRTVVQKADSAIEKLENQRRKSAKTPNSSHFKNKTETLPPPVIFASKTFDLNNKNNDSDNDQSEFKVHNVSHFAEQERSQLGELSHALREIRLRYETVKRQFSKAAGTTTFIEEDAQNGTNQTEFGQNLNNETLSNTDNGTIGIAPEGTTAEQQSIETKTLASQEIQTTAVPIPNSSKNTRKPSVEHKNVNNEINEEESIQNIGKAKPKLTLTELAAELEQIERTIATRNGKAGLKELEIESGTLQKAKKILQKGKKSRQKGRARVFSSPPPADKALKTIKAAATHRDGHQHKAEKQPQKQKSRGNNNEVPIRAETTGQPTKPQQQQAVQQLSHSTQQQQPSQTRLPIPPATPDISKLKTVIVDTSTQNGHSDVQHQQQQQQPKILHSQQNNQLHQQTQQQHFQPQNHQPQQVQQQLHSPSFQQQQQHFQSVQHNQMPQQNPTQPSQQQQHYEQQQHQQLDHPQQQPEQQRAFVQHPQQLTQLPQRIGHGQSVRTNAEDGGFYQLERAQVTNVSQKVPKPPASSELKLKGVAQLAVSKGNGPQSPAEISSSQLGSQLRKERLGKNGTKQPKEDDDLANLEEFARIDEQAICDAIACNFETGTLCEWETSIDELNPDDPRYRRYMMARTVLLTRRRRSKRNDDEFVRDEENEEEEIADFGQNLLPNSVEETTMATATTTRKKPDQTADSKPPQGGRTVLRSWHNWVGRYRNRLTGISQSEVFSTRNQRFAASYLKAGQRSMLTGRLLSGDRTTIRFRAWEATRALQLRVCCDRTDRDENCVFETELGAKRASRKWKDHLATCPQGTKKIIFECRNNGPFQGACGVDNIQLVNAYCPSVTPMKANRMLKL